MAYDAGMSIITSLFGRKRPDDPVAERIDSLMRDNRRLFAELDEVRREFGRLARSTWRVQEDERRHIARELHDHLGQTLTALVHRLDAAGDQPDKDVAELARKALEDTRELSRILRPPVLDDLGIGAALEWLARRAGDSAGVDVSVSVDDLPGRPDPDVESLLFRIAQESLNNVIKHSGARHVKIALTRTGNRLELRIRDDGAGFDPDAVASREDRGIGLDGMRDRVRLFGGEIAIVSAPGHGTAITVAVEMRTEAGRGTIDQAHPSRGDPPK